MFYIDWLYESKERAGISPSTGRMDWTLESWRSPWAHCMGIQLCCQLLSLGHRPLHPALFRQSYPQSCVLLGNRAPCNELQNTHRMTHSKQPKCNHKRGPSAGAWGVVRGDWKKEVPQRNLRRRA